MRPSAWKARPRAPRKYNMFLGPGTLDTTRFCTGGRNLLNFRLSSNSEISATASEYSWMAGLPKPENTSRAVRDARRISCRAVSGSESSD